MIKPSNLLSIFMIVSWPALFFLATLAGIHRYWLTLSILSSALAINVSISSGLLLALRIEFHTKQLEELISKEDRVKED